MSDREHIARQVWIAAQSAEVLDDFDLHIIRYDLVKFLAGSRKCRVPRHPMDCSTAQSTRTKVRRRRQRIRGQIAEYGIIDAWRRGEALQ